MKCIYNWLATAGFIKIWSNVCNACRNIATLGNSECGLMAAALGEASARLGSHTLPGSTQFLHTLPKNTVNGFFDFTKFFDINRHLCKTPREYVALKSGKSLVFRYQEAITLFLNRKVESGNSYYYNLKIVIRRQIEISFPKICRKVESGKLSGDL